MAAAALWIAIALDIRAQRLALGESWLRMALILGLVAALSLLPAILLEGRKAKAWFAPRVSEEDGPVGEGFPPG